MWLCLPDAFLSIVAMPDRPDLLKVRARRPGDIERYFPEVPVQRTPGRDYLYRAEIHRTQVAAVLCKAVMQIDAPNFKNSVQDPTLHAAYADVWQRMAGLQSPRPYSHRGN